MRYLFGLMCVLALGAMGCGQSLGAQPECQTPEDCDDGNECTENSCVSGMCGSTQVADGAACGDDAGICQDGSCEVACTEQGIRDAIAGGGGPYTFSCEGPQVVATQAEIIIDNDVILDGESNLTVDGGGDHRVFLVEEGVTAGLRGLTVTRGGWIEPRVASEDGGGILNAGTLSLLNCSVTECSIPGSANPMGGFGSGGGISNPGTLTMRNCTVSGNSAGDGGGGIFNGGTAIVTNSTVSGNLPDGVFNVHGGTMEITNSTVSAEGDVAISKLGGPGTLTLFANLIDGSCVVTDPDIAIDSNGYNIESPGDTCGLDQVTDRVDVSPDDLRLGPLQDNGGPTQTRALGAGSVGVDVIPRFDCVDPEGALLTTDQRGEPRPETGGDDCDLGAFERQPDDE